MTRVLGAILAGGQSRRFGSDKAVASWRGEPQLLSSSASGPAINPGHCGILRARH